MKTRPKWTSRRRWAMLFVSFMTIAHGLIIIGDPFREPGPNAYYLIPIGVRIGLWLGTGAVGAVIALAGPRKAEWIGWFLLILMPAQRLAGHLLGLILHLTPGGRAGTADSAAFVLLWFGGVGLVVVLSGWKESAVEELAARDENRGGP